MERMLSWRYPEQTYYYVVILHRNAESRVPMALIMKADDVVVQNPGREHAGDVEHQHRLDMNIPTNDNESKFQQTIMSLSM